MATLQPTQVLPRFLGSSKTSEKKTNGLSYGKTPSKRTELVATSNENLIEIHRNTSKILITVCDFPSLPEGPIETLEMSCGKERNTTIHLTSVTCIQVALAHQSATHEFLPCPTSQCWCFQNPPSIYTPIIYTPIIYTLPWQIG